MVCGHTAVPYLAAGKHAAHFRVDECDARVDALQFDGVLELLDERERVGALRMRR